VRVLHSYSNRLQQFDALTTVTWASVAVLILAQLPTMSQLGKQMLWPISITGLASCLALSELRRRRAEVNVHALQAASTTDPLTGAFNRRWLDIEMKHRFAQFKRQNMPFSILLVDIDHFKSINDTRGHAAGDAVLASVAREMGKTIRDMDVLFRIGGEEFVIVLPGTNSCAATVASERLRSAIERTSFQVNHEIVPVTVSIGATTVRPTDTAEEILKRADDAMYSAKRHGRNQCVIAPEIQSERNAVLKQDIPNNLTATAPFLSPCPQSDYSLALPASSEVKS